METITRDQFDNLQIGNQLKSECYSLTVEAKVKNTIIAVDNNDAIAGAYSFDGLVRGEYSIISNLKLLEKARREYAIGTNIKSIYDGNIYICNTKPFFYDSFGHIYVKDENEYIRCIYDKELNQWAETIKEETMTQQEFNSLEVGEFISQYKILLKYKDFLIVKCDDVHDLFDLEKINKLGLSVKPKTFMGLEVKKYDNVPIEIDNRLYYLIEVAKNEVIFKANKKQSTPYIDTPTSIRIL